MKKRNIGYGASMGQIASRGLARLFDNGGGFPCAPRGERNHWACRRACPGLVDPKVLRTGRPPGALRDASLAAPLLGTRSTGARLAVEAAPKWVTGAVCGHPCRRGMSARPRSASAATTTPAPRESAPVTRMASKPLETVETRSDDSARAHDSASRRRSDHREPVALRPIGSAQAKRNRKRPSEGRWRGPASRRSGVAESCTFRRPVLDDGCANRIVTQRGGDDASRPSNR